MSATDFAAYKFANDVLLVPTVLMAAPQLKDLENYLKIEQSAGRVNIQKGINIKYLNNIANITHLPRVRPVAQCIGRFSEYSMTVSLKPNYSEKFYADFLCYPHLKVKISAGEAGAGETYRFRKNLAEHHIDSCAFRIQTTEQAKLRGFDIYTYKNFDCTEEKRKNIEYLCGDSIVDFVQDTADPAAASTVVISEKLGVDALTHAAATLYYPLPFWFYRNNKGFLNTTSTSLEKEFTFDLKPITDLYQMTTTVNPVVTAPQISELALVMYEVFYARTYANAFMVSNLYDIMTTNSYHTKSINTNTFEYEITTDGSCNHIDFGFHDPSHDESDSTWDKFAMWANVVGAPRAASVTTVNATWQGSYLYDKSEADPKVFSHLLPSISHNNVCNKDPGLHRFDFRSIETPDAADYASWIHLSNSYRFNIKGTSAFGTTAHELIASVSTLNIMGLSEMAIGKRST